MLFPSSTMPPCPKLVSSAPADVKRETMALPRLSGLSPSELTELQPVFKNPAPTIRSSGPSRVDQRPGCRLPRLSASEPPPWVAESTIPAALDLVKAMKSRIVWFPHCAIVGNRDLPPIAMRPSAWIDTERAAPVPWDCEGANRPDVP